MTRRKGFQTYREKWRAAVIKTATLPAPTKLFLSGVLADGMDTSGRVSVPRAVLADRMGCDERTISRHVQRAKDKGWLTVANPGHRGMTAVYRAEFPNGERVTPAVTLSRPRKGDTLYHPFRVTNLSPFTPASARERVTPAVTPRISTYVERGTWATNDKTAHGHVPNDDAFEEGINGLLSRRVAPTTEQLILTAGNSSSSSATRHLVAVPA